MICPMPHEGNLLLGAIWPGATSTSRSRLKRDHWPVQMLRFLETALSSLPVSCCTQERFNGLEEKPSAYCHRTRKPGPSPKQETENLSCESNRTNWLDYWSIGKSQLLLQQDCELLSTAGSQSTAAVGNDSVGSSRPAKHGTTRTGPQRSWEEARVGQLKGCKEAASNTFVEVPKELQGNFGVFQDNRNRSEELGFAAELMQHHMD